MQINHVFQVLVPLTFLAIWALTSLLNREAQPLPPRPGRPPIPPGPRQAGSTAPRPPDRRLEPANRPATDRWGNPVAPPKPELRRPAARMDDDIVILDDRRSGAQPPPNRSGGNAPQRRLGRKSGSAPAAQKRQEPASPARTLAGDVSKSNEATIGRFLELNPLAGVQTPLSSSTVAATAGVAPLVPGAIAPLALTTTKEIVTAVNSIAKLRESLILSEILQPPLALRPHRRFR